MVPETTEDLQTTRLEHQGYISVAVEGYWSPWVDTRLFQSVEAAEAYADRLASSRARDEELAVKYQ